MHHGHSSTYAESPELVEDVYADEYEDAAAGELVGCIDRMCAEISDNPELLDDLRWELELMNIRMGRAVH